jgi:hypothetical protein
VDNTLTILAFSIYYNKGVYAFLLGSGISKSAGIPTGWDVSLDLIQKLAAQNGEKCKSSEVQWFEEKYSIQPNYSTILSKLAVTPTERVNLLKPYFEATDEEREQHLKEPSKAHKAIAQLAKNGHIKVVITTNFDRLLETALQEVGITPQVIRCIEDIDGALPLMHAPFTIIKINGDYLDCRFLNTETELSDYPQKLKDYLLRIVNEFGLISCGWSAKWDIGLVSTIRQAESRRFNSFWTYVGKCEKELQDLSDFRQGETIEIQNADSFFIDIQERISALENLNNNHPLNADIAVQRLKKHIVKEENKILLHDLLQQETDISCNKIKEIDDFSLSPSPEILLPQIEKYKAAISILLPLCINGVYWCNEKQEPFFISILKKIAEPPKSPNGSFYQITKDFHYFPSIIVYYSMGVAAVISSKYAFLKNIFYLKYNKYEGNYEPKHLITKLNPITLCENGLNDARKILGDKYTPISTTLCDILKKYFKTILGSEQEFENYFDIFEYLLSLNFMHISERRNWLPVGQYIWKQDYYKNTMLSEFFNEATLKQTEWLPIQAGMFDGKFETYVEVKQKSDEFIKQSRCQFL